MNNLETLLWEVGDYLAMPLLFLTIFIALSVSACLLLSWLDKRKRSV